MTIVLDKAIETDETNARAHALKACTIGGGYGKVIEDPDKMMDMGLITSRKVLKPMKMILKY